MVSSIASLVLMLTFLLFGPAVLEFFGITISISEFQIAGGVLLGGIGFSMMNSSSVSSVSGKTRRLLIVRSWSQQPSFRSPSR